MTEPPQRPVKGKSPEEIRKARLAVQLRANLQKRKAQTRARRTGAEDQRPDGLQSSGPASGEPAKEI